MPEPTLPAESVAPLLPPDAERLLVAIDHLDAAYEAAKSVDGQVCAHIHLAREEAKRIAGLLTFQHQRRIRALRNDGHADG